MMKMSIYPSGLILQTNNSMRKTLGKSQLMDILQITNGQGHQKQRKI